MPWKPAQLLGLLSVSNIWAGFTFVWYLRWKFWVWTPRRAALYPLPIHIFNHPSRSLANFLHPCQDQSFFRIPITLANHSSTPRPPTLPYPTCNPLLNRQLSKFNMYNPTVGVVGMGYGRGRPMNWFYEKLYLTFYISLFLYMCMYRI